MSHSPEPAATPRTAIGRSLASAAAHAAPRELGEKCGVVGIHAPGRQVGATAVRALQALQHRGQESAGVCTADAGHLRNVTGMGLVREVFGPREVMDLHGSLAIGHTRYSTTGASRGENAQPILVSSDIGELALAHNGNLVNVRTLRAAVAALRVQTRTSTDSELPTSLRTRRAVTG